MARVDKTDGMSAEGSGRVSLMADSGLVHSYTLECNYNTGKALNHVPAAHGGHQGRASPERTVTSPPKYGPEHWMEVGRAVLVALLDMKELNPWSRVGNSKYRTVDRARTSVCAEIRQRAPFQKQSLDRRFSERQERHAAEAKAKKLQRAQDIRADEAAGIGGSFDARSIAGDLKAATSGARGGGGAGTWSKGASRFGNPSQHANNANPITASSSSSSGCGGGGGNESAGRGSAVAMKQAARARRIAAASAAVSAATSMARSSSGGSSSTSGRKGGGAKRAAQASRKRSGAHRSGSSGGGGEGGTSTGCGSTGSSSAAGAAVQSGGGGGGPRPETNSTTPTPESSSSSSSSTSSAVLNGGEVGGITYIAGGRPVQHVVSPQSLMLKGHGSIGRSSVPKKPTGKASNGSGGGSRGQSRGAKVSTTRIPQLKRRMGTRPAGTGEKAEVNSMVEVPAVTREQNTNPLLPVVPKTLQQEQANGHFDPNGVVDGNALPYPNPVAGGYRQHPPLSAGRRRYVLGASP
jgi:hypothetical protein